MRKENVAIITSGVLPVPAVKGGAVESLIENFVKQNEDERLINIKVFSVFDDLAKKASMKYFSSSFIFIKTPKIINLIDKEIYLFAKFILRKKNTNTYSHILRRLHFIIGCRKYLKKYDFDKILFENHYTELLAIRPISLKEKYKGKIYYHAHNLPTCAGLIKKELNSITKIICVSSYLEKATKKVLNLQDNKFSVVRNGINENDFHPISEPEVKKVKSYLKLKENDFVIMFAGRMTKEKGIFELIKALQELNFNYKFVIVGAQFYGYKSRSVEQDLIEKELSNISGKCIFTGFVPYNEMNEMYSVADIVVLPSIWDDPAPLTVIEALKCGKPLITTNSGGIPEYARNCSIILNKDDDLPKQIANSLTELHNSRAKRLELSKEALYCSKGFNIENFYNNLCKALN